MINNAKLLIQNGRTAESKKSRADLIKIIDGVLESIDPYELVLKNINLKKNILTVGGNLKLDITKYKNIYLVGAGKAVYKMSLAVESILGDKICSGCINIPILPVKNCLKKITVCKSSHPLPDAAGVEGTKKIKQTLLGANKDDLIIAVISGGGSSLMPLPAEGITLKEKMALTTLMLKTPATVNEINVIRKHLSQIKGGQFACLAYPATLVTLYISDVIDDPYDVLASGPTTPDPSTFFDAVAILKKYKIWKQTPEKIKERLEKGIAGIIPETPKETHEAFCKGKIYNFTIANHNTAVEAAAKFAKKIGYTTLELSSFLQGEACEVAKVIVSIGKNILRYKKPVKAPCVIIFGGETTVAVHGNGKGGRNQELVLSAIPQLMRGMAIASFGTDGIDGFTPTPVAGALADLSTREASLEKKLDISSYMSRNDSYHFFEKLGDHIITGPTGTNIGDIILLLIR